MTSFSNTVLLVGEGNFSFAVSYLEHIHKNGLNLNVIATDLKPNNTQLDALTLENVEFLKSQGVIVLLDLDARFLHKHSILRRLMDENCKFSKIIFNFPQTQCGKKMKIGLNRQLLRNFFESVAHLCTDEKTKVCVSLCAGQGGIPADTKSRRFGDSWQIVEMATFGGFILTKVELFKAFGNYSSAGFRGTSKQFNVDDSLTYIFVKRMLRTNTCGSWNAVCNSFTNEAISLFPNCSIIERNFDYIVTENPYKLFVAIRDINLDFLSEKLSTLLKRNIRVESERESIKIDDSDVGSVVENTFLLSIPALFAMKYNVDDFRLLRSSFARFHGDTNRVTTDSLYPASYVHDISFWIIDPQKWKEKWFVETVYHVLGSVVKSITLLESFTENVADGRISKCYRVIHQSIDCSLSKLESNDLQQTLREALRSSFEDMITIR